MRWFVLTSHKFSVFWVGVALASMIAFSGAKTAADPPAEPAWVRCGGPLGGLGYDVRMDPGSPDLMWVTDAFAGVFRSDDGGATWTPSNQGITTRTGFSGDAIPVFSLTLDPNDPRIVWAGTQSVRGIFKSTDGGLTWLRKENGVTEDEGITFRGFTVDPNDSNVVYAAAELSSFTWFGEVRQGREFDLVGGVVYKTTDGGENWSSVWRGPNLARYVWIDPGDTDTVYVSTGIFDREAANSDPTAGTPGGVGVIKSEDGGATWNPVNSGLDNLYVGTLFMHPSDPLTLLAGSGNNQYNDGAGVFLTEDGGKNWRRVISGQGFNSVEFAVEDPDIAYAANPGAVYRSRDRGRTWVRATAAEDGWGPPGVRAGFPIDLQVDPRDPTRLFANNYGGGNFLSEDGGRTWVAASQGYTGAQVRDIAANPRFPGEVVAAARSGLFGSQDGGRDWEGWNYQPAWVLEWNAVAVDPANDEHVLAANNWDQSVLETFDRGRTWRRRLSATSTNASWRRLVFAPSNPQVVYAGSSAFFSAGTFDDSLTAEGVHVSRDAGKTWSPANDTVSTGANVVDIAVHPGDETILYAATGNKGLLMSVDGGSAWSRLTAGLTASPHALSVAVDPGDPHRVLAGWNEAGLYRSLDAGVTWQAVASGVSPQASISDIVFDARRPNVVYLANLASGVHRSTDGGENWQSFGTGLSTRQVNRLALAGDSRHLYAATEGGGVLRLDLDGEEPPDSERGLLFAQYGNGEGFTSGIVLTNPSTGVTVSGQVHLFGDSGQPLDVSSGGSRPSGEEGLQPRTFSIPPLGKWVFSTSGEGPLDVGSASVEGSGRLGGVIRFQIPDIGIAGVGESRPLRRWLAPVRRLAEGINTGVALQNPEPSPLELMLLLRNEGGDPISEPLHMVVPPLGHVARFVDQLFPQVEGVQFRGAIEATALEGLVSATAMELGGQPGEFTTLPVAEILDHTELEPSALRFAQFGFGEGIQSDLVVVNVQAEDEISGSVRFFDDNGAPLEVALEASGAGGVVLSTDSGEADFRIPPLGQITLSTTGRGTPTAGTAVVSVDAGRAAGVVRYRIGGIGIAGVGESRPLPGAIMPVRRRDGEINTGVAFQNVSETAINLALRLRDEAGNAVSEARVLSDFPPGAHSAMFVDQLFPQVDTDDFSGTLSIQADEGLLVATALELGVEAGRFTTLPVTPLYGFLEIDAEPAGAPAAPKTAKRADFRPARPPRADFLQGTVTHGESPLAGATVRIQGSRVFRLTDAEGRFRFEGLPSFRPVNLTASALGYYIGVLENCLPAAGSELVLELEPHPATDNPDYRWLPSVPGPDGDPSGTCAECHSGLGLGLDFTLPVDEWLLDAHSQTVSNPRFLSLYAGTDLEGRRSPPTRYANLPDYGRIPLLPDPSLPYFGPGFRLDFPDSAGNCAACHAPAASINAPYGVDPRGLQGVEAEGVPCDFCHKVWDVRLDPRTGLPYPERPGVLSFEFRRPPEGSQFFAGPLDDVAPGEDVHSPLQNRSEFCAPCHFGVFWGVTIYNSFGEWLDSPYSDPETGKTCQDCHMPRLGAVRFAASEKGGRIRDPASIFSHAMPGALDPALLESALTLESSLSRRDDRLLVSVEIRNDATGHHVPTDSPLRQVILLVQAFDGRGRLLERSAGPVIPEAGGLGDPRDGHYAGLPGEIFAKVLEEFWTEASPSAAYWRMTRLVSDNRIAAFEKRVLNFEFRAPDKGEVTVRVRLLFRRAPIELMTQKSWNTPDIQMAEELLRIGDG